MAAESENIGQVNVAIVGDYSPLVSALQQGEQLAAAGGKAIGEALVAGADQARNLGTQLVEQLQMFDQAAGQSAEAAATWQASIESAVASGMTLAEAVARASQAMQDAEAPTAEEAEQLSLFGDALSSIPFADASGQLNMFADELEPFSAGTADAAAKAKDLASSEQEVEEATKPAAASIEDLTKQLLAAGVALAITNKIRELAAEALGASDSITRADISLTALSGDANKASQEVEALENLAIQDGLSMPGLLQAATRMQALLGSAQPVPAILGQLANSAVVAGSSIESAASAFDRIALSGAVSARTLAPLGINLQDIAVAFNQVTDTSLATDKNINVLMKDLGETDRIDVLRAALGKLNGVAQETADKTFGGQFQQLVAQWERVFAEAGDAMKPVLTDLIEFTKVDIVPAAKAVFEAFNALPGPVKDLAVGLGLVSIAAVPVAVALGTMGHAVTGIGALIGAGTSLFKGFAVANTEVAAAEGTAAVAAGTLSTALNAIPYVALAVALGQLAFSYHALREAQDGAEQTQQELQDTVAKMTAALRAQGINIDEQVDAFNNAIDAGQDYGTALTKLLQQLHQLSVAHNEATAASRTEAEQSKLTAQAIKTISDAANENAIQYKIALDAYNALNAKFAAGKATAAEVAAALDGVNAAAAKIPGTIEPVNVAMANMARATQQAVVAHQQASSVFTATLAAYRAGAATYAQLVASQNALTTSEEAAAAAGAPIPGTLQAIDLAAKSVTSSMVSLASTQDIAAARTQAQAATVRDLYQDVEVASQKLVLLVVAEHDAQIAADAGRISVDQLRQVTEAVSQASADLTQKQEALQQALLRQQNAAALAAGQIGVMRQSLLEANLAFDQAKAKAELGTISLQAYAAAQKAAMEEQVAYNQAAADLSVNASRSTDALALLDSAYAQAKIKTDAVTQAYKEQLASLQELQGAQKSELDSQIALDQQMAVQATGLATATDKIGLLTTQVAAAKAKVDDLTRAVQSNVPVQGELISAEQQLESLQKQLNDAITATKPPLDQATVAMHDNAAAANTDAAAIENLGAKAKDASTQIKSVSQALSEIDAAVSTGGPKSAVLGAGLSAPPGGYLSPVGGFQGGNPFFGLVGYNPSPSQGQTWDITQLVKDLYDQGYTPSGELSVLDNIYGVPVDNVNKILNVLGLPNSPDALGMTKQMYNLAHPTPESTSPSSTSTPGTASVIAASSTSGALDTASGGGSYPGVVIHQAAGELLYVALVANAAAFQSSASASPADTASQASALAATSVASTVSAAADTMSNVVGDLQSLGGSLGAIATAVQTVAAQVSTLVVGAVQNVPKAGTVTSGGLPVVNSNTSKSVPTTPTNVGINSQYSNPYFDPYLQGLPIPPATTAVLSQSPIYYGANFTGANFAGANPTQVKQAVDEAITQSFTRQLREAGARNLTQ